MPHLHWSRLQEHTAGAGIRLFYLLFRLGGRITFYATLWPVIVFYWIVLSQPRRASRDYLNRLYAHGLLTRKPAFYSSLLHLVRFADTVLDKLLAVSGYFKPADLTVVGREALLAQDRGGILMTAHMGCLEICQALSSHDPRHPLLILVHTGHAVRFNQILSRLNPRFAVNHIEVGSLTPDIAIQLSEHVERGGFLVIAGDRTPIHSQAVTQARFLGKDAPFPVGAYLLATLLNCPLWSMICTRDSAPSSARYIVHFTCLSPSQKISRRQRDAHFSRLAQIYADELETHLRRQPLDWFNFYDFWDQEGLVKNSTQKPPM